MDAKFYTYLNIKTREFSVKHRGRVVARGAYFVVADASFKVSEKGRQQVLSTGRKNVHAYVVSRDMPRMLSQKEYNSIRYNTSTAERYHQKVVTYNPYRVPFFGVEQDSRHVRALFCSKLIGCRGKLTGSGVVLSKIDMVDTFYLAA